MSNIFIATSKKVVIFFLLSLFPSIIFAETNILSDRDKEILVNLSRQTLYWYVKDRVAPQVDEEFLTDSLKSRRGVFVSLYSKDTGLRGCIGLFPPTFSPLYKNVIDRTIAAATKDNRFKPVEYSELKNIKLEISVLTNPKVLKFDSSQDLLDKLEPYEDGVIISTKYGTSTYLPQVWEQIPDKGDFLSSLCRKHGAPHDYWRTNFKDIKIQTYKAIVFGEEIYGRTIVGKNGAIAGKNGAYVMGHVKPVKEGFVLGGYKVKEGTSLTAGTIVTPDSDIIE